MEQSEIDALLAGGAKKGGEPKKGKTAAAAAPKAAPAPSPPPASAAAAEAPAAASKAGPKPDQGVRVIGELGAVTAVTERETNKVMDKLDQISQLLDKQKDIVTQIMGHDNAQNQAIKSAIQEIMAAGADIQNKIYEAMDLMQFQDISRQKLERIIHHLRQIHDYILDLLGTGFQAEKQVKASISHSIAQTGTTPDENKSHADSVVDEFIRSNKPDKKD